MLHEPGLFVGCADEPGRGTMKPRPLRRPWALDTKTRPKRSAADARTSLCTYCHAPLGPEMQAAFNLSPLFTDSPPCEERAFTICLPHPPARLDASARMPEFSP